MSINVAVLFGNRMNRLLLTVASYFSNLMLHIYICTRNSLRELLACQKNELIDSFIETQHDSKMPTEMEAPKNKQPENVEGIKISPYLHRKEVW